MKTWTYNVLPNLPERLDALRKIAYNLWFSWDWEAVQLFIRLGEEYWQKSYQNPVRLLGLIPQKRYDAILQDDSFLAWMDRVEERFQEYMDSETWFDRTFKKNDGLVAYFSCEYGMDEGLPVYSGGLGILSGDHLKSASDLGLPLCAVGLLYREGYFRQYLNADGYQQEEYPENDWYTMPVNLVTNGDGEPLKITVNMLEEEVAARIWKVQVGRVTLFLLDTNIPENSPHQREVTSQLYGGDRDMRIRQEILLGIGGLRALWAMGLEPSVCHMNEGHSAFLALERIAHFMQKDGLTHNQAKELVWATNVFTTHTPVVAGNERFDPELVRRYMEPYLSSFGLDWNGLLAMGREDPSDNEEAFCMTVLALKLAAHCNGVARLHGEVSRKMWNVLWPTLPTNEVPIGHVTNGIHNLGWSSHDMRALFERYLGPQVITEPTKYEIYKRIDNIPDSELWRTHERRRERLVTFVRQRLVDRGHRRGAPQREMILAEEVLDPEALTIGFARRFATYKRGTLLFFDSARLEKILNNTERPVQLLFAGKSHPHDEPGKALIREIVHYSREPRFQGKIVFIEDYDIAVGRYLTQGVDVWLNTPRRPLEASGTSGMKAAVSGALNASILDGWWDEAYNPDVGWAIGNREVYEDPAVQDWVESQALYDLIEQEIVPSFYTRGRDGLPRDWIKKMKASMSQLGAFFNTNRMLEDYTRKMYMPAAEKAKTLSANNMSRTKELEAWKTKLEREWPLITIQNVEPEGEDRVVGSAIKVKAQVQLGGLTTNDVSVELYYGAMNSKGDFRSEATSPMQPGEPVDGAIRYEGSLPCDISGRFGFAVRVLPRNEDLCHPYLPGLICWAK